MKFGDAPTLWEARRHVGELILTTCGAVFDFEFTLRHLIDLPLMNWDMSVTNGNATGDEHQPLGLADFTLVLR